LFSGQGFPEPLGQHRFYLRFDAVRADIATADELPAAEGTIRVASAKILPDVVFVSYAVAAGSAFSYGEFLCHFPIHK